MFFSICLVKIVVLHCFGKSGFNIITININATFSVSKISDPQYIKVISIDHHFFVIQPFYCILILKKEFCFDVKESAMGEIFFIKANLRAVNDQNEREQRICNDQYKN